MADDLNTINRLKKHSRFLEEGDVEYFEEGVWKIAERKDPQNISVLIDLFDDKTPFPEVMYSLVHALESYPDEVYTQEIIKNISSMLKNSPEWLLILTYRIFNSPSCLEVFKKNISSIPKESMVELLNLVARESEHHKDLCDELRRLVEEKAKAQ